MTSFKLPSKKTPNDWKTPLDGDFIGLLKRSGVKRVVAISDIHGWYGPFLELLVKSGIIKRAGEEGDGVFRVENDLFRYCGGSVILVIVGDFVDVDSEGKNVMDLLVNLEVEAKENGGELIAISGNHERNFLKLGPRYWGQIDGYRKWIESRPLAAIVNDVLFIHGGISKRALDIVDGSQKEGEDFISAFERRLLGDDTLCWEVTNKTFTLQDQNTLKKLMDRLKIEYMVIGHVSTYGKKRSEIKLVGPKIEKRPRVFNIDTEMGNWYIGYTGKKKTNGGALSFRWEKDELFVEYIYRDNYC